MQLICCEPISGVNIENYPIFAMQFICCGLISCVNIENYPIFAMQLICCEPINGVNIVTALVVGQLPWRQLPIDKLLLRTNTHQENYSSANNY